MCSTRILWFVTLVLKYQSSSKFSKGSAPICAVALCCKLSERTGSQLHQDLFEPLPPAWQVNVECTVAACPCRLRFARKVWHPVRTGRVEWSGPPCQDGAPTIRVGQGHQELSGESDENNPLKPNQSAPSIYIMIEICYFSLDQWEIRIHLLSGKCFNIPHDCDPHLDQTKWI